LVATYTYGGDGLKRFELVDGTATTLIWDRDRPQVPVGRHARLPRHEPGAERLLRPHEALWVCSSQARKFRRSYTRLLGPIGPCCGAWIPWPWFGHKVADILARTQSADEGNTKRGATAIGTRYAVLRVPERARGTPNRPAPWRPGSPGFFLTTSRMLEVQNEAMVYMSGGPCTPGGRTSSASVLRRSGDVRVRVVIDTRQD
jgi:hypothetical protein